MFAACPFVPPTAASVRRVAAPYKWIAENVRKCEKCLCLVRGVIGMIKLYAPTP